MNKGPDNFGDDAWMGFRDNRFVLNCELEEEATLSKVIISSFVHTDPRIFPPSNIKILGGKIENRDPVKIHNQDHDEKVADLGNGLL